MGLVTSHYYFGTTSTCHWTNRLPRKSGSSSGGKIRRFGALPPFGLVATVGTYFAQTEKITLLSFIVAIPMGALACAILAVNNIRDRAQDELVGKRTVAVRLGDTKARRAFVALLVLAHTAAILAIKNEIYAAIFTDFAEANPLATNRVGPIRLVSVPLTPSL